MGAKLTRFVLTAFFCVVVCSCVSRRTITHTKQENATETKIITSTDSISFERFWNAGFIHIADSSTTEQFVDIVIYDTQSVDSTGAYPVKATAHITTIAKNATVTEKRDTTGREILKHYSDTLSVTSRDTMSVVADQERTSKPSAATNNMSFAFLAFAVLLFLLAIYTYKQSK